MRTERASRSAKVLVTGSRGFTGRYLTTELERLGYSTVELDEADCDLRQREEVVRFVDRVAPDFVIHLAAVSHLLHQKPGDFYEINTVGTTNLLDALVTVGTTRKVILASSSQVYGRTQTTVITETEPCQPSSHYACSKAAMEHMASTYLDRLAIVITRPFNYTGPGQSESFLVPKIVSHFAHNAPKIGLGNLGVVRDFSDVRMVADAYCRLLRAPLRDGVVNICSGVGRPVGWIIDECRRITGHALDVVVQAELVRGTDVMYSVGSNARLVEAIGPLKHTDLSATLQDMIRAAQHGADQPGRS